MAILCGALPKNHRKKTICSQHREGYVVGHSKQNQAKTFNIRLFYGSVCAEKIRKFNRDNQKTYNKIWTSNFSLLHCGILARTSFVSQSTKSEVDIILSITSHLTTLKKNSDKIFSNLFLFQMNKKLDLFISEKGQMGRHGIPFQAQ